MSDKEGGLEQHLTEILKHFKPLSAEYTRYLAHIYQFDSKLLPAIQRDDGDCYIQFHLKHDFYKLNSAHYLYEIDEIAPKIKWRNLLRNSQSLYQVVLRKKTAFLPAYSFSLDRLLTFVYWGEKQFFFDPEKLRELKLQNFLINVEKPSNMQVSAANLAWPRAIGGILPDNSIGTDLANRYLFNVLYPPDIKNFFSIWKESPFLIIGDNWFQAHTLHKSICAVDKSSLRNVGGGVMADVAVLDNELTSQITNCYIPDECLNLVEKPMVEAILMKSISLKPNLEKPLTRLTLYPFESTFLEDGFGVTLTALSICLRSLYLASSSPYVVGNITQVQEKIRNMLSQYPFDTHSWTDLASQMLKEDSLEILLKIFGVYHNRNGEIIYLHPSLIECLSALLGGLEKVIDKGAMKYLSNSIEIGEKIPATGFVSLSQKLRLQDELKGLAEGVRIKDMDKFLVSLVTAKNSIIPLSKLLNSQQY